MKLKPSFGKISIFLRMFTLFDLEKDLFEHISASYDGIYRNPVKGLDLVTYRTIFGKMSDLEEMFFLQDISVLCANRASRTSEWRPIAHILFLGSQTAEPMLRIAW